MSKKEDTLKLFKERIDSGKSIKYNDFLKEDSSLYYSIQRYFGGIHKASLKLGIDEETLIKEYGLTRNINKRTLTEKEILDRLLYLKSIGRLTTNAMRLEFDDQRLELSIKKLYGSVEEGLKHFNLKRDTVRVSKSSLEKQIRRYSKKGVEMSYTNMLKIDSKLVYNSTNKFKMSWHSILDSMKIDYSSKLKRLTKQNIEKRLDKIKERTGEINYKVLQRYDSSILYYAYENYDSILEFYIDMGLDPNECMDFSQQKNKGFEFERLFAEMLDTLNIEYLHNKTPVENPNIRPDFQLRKGTWIDCKLSSWTSSIEETIEKYSPYCKKLIIVFNRGKYEYLPTIDSDNVEFRKIDYYYPYLYKINRHDLIERFENIIKNNEI